MTPSVPDEILCDDPLFKRKDVRVAALNARAQPVAVGIAERLDTRKVFESAFAPATDKRFVDSEIVTIAVYEHDRLSERNRLSLQRIEEFIEPRAQLVSSG